MKSDIAQIRRKTWKNNFEGLDGTIQVHVKHSIVIVPNSGGGASHLVTDEEDSVVARVGLNLLYCSAGSCPRLDSRLHSHRATDWRKAKIRRAAGYRELTIGEIVKHVALAGMRLAPGVFMRSNVGGFAKIGRTRILSCVQISHVNQNPV